MTKAQIYPKADASTQWWENSFDRGTFTRIEKILLHSTETPSWPGYKSGASAPTLTYYAKQRKWRQHNKIGSSARALVDPSGTAVRENRDNVIQIEIIAYADKKVADTVSGSVKIVDLTADNLRDLAEFIVWVRKEWGGPPKTYAKFIDYPGSYGNSAVRMSGSQYDGFQGILGHMHASGNMHGDPGAIDIAAIAQYVNVLEGQDIMATLDAEDLKNIAAAVWQYPLVNRVTQKAWSAGSYNEGAAIWAADAKRASEASLALDKANAAALAALSANPDLTAERLQEIVEQAVGNVIGDGLSGTVTVDFDQSQAEAPTNATQ